MPVHDAQTRCLLLVDESLDGTADCQPMHRVHRQLAVMHIVLQNVRSTVGAAT
jgi:hypothetical protein